MLHPSLQTRIDNTIARLFIRIEFDPADPANAPCLKDEALVTLYSPALAHRFLGVTRWRKGKRRVVRYYELSQISDASLSRWMLLLYGRCWPKRSDNEDDTVVWQTTD